MGRLAVAYDGLDPALRTAVSIRDCYRCRWCGRTDVPTDPHHIRYRRGAVDDTEDNLILLCRQHHGFVHGDKNARGESIWKPVAQGILWELIEKPGMTGMALWRQRKRQWSAMGYCEHGQPPGSCSCGYRGDDDV